MTERTTHPSSTHPPLHPPKEDEQFARLRLLRSYRVGITTYRRLLAEHGTARAALEALPDVAAAAGLASYRPCPEGVLRAELETARQAGAKLLMEEDSQYPARLRDTPGAPPFLWVLGDVELLTRPLVSLVGARNASSLGMRMARKLARELGAAGYVIVSGLARGIDAAAHRAALDCGTIAVQAGGVDIRYPSENADLADAIAQRGLRLSEQPMGLKPLARHFPLRNRIISGLSAATVVVEGAARSGALITARDALDQGREVLAVPGHPFDARAAGCNLLLRDGATLVRDAADVLEALQSLGAEATPPRPGLQGALPLPQPPPPERRSLRETMPLHMRILSRLGPAPVAEDQLIRDLRVSSSAAAPALMELEIEGRIVRRPGGMVTRDN